MAFSSPEILDRTSAVSLASTAVLLAAAAALARRVLPPSTPPAHRALFVWHAFDALIHALLEGGYLYHCFFSSVVVDGFDEKLGNWYPSPPHFLGDSSAAVAAGRPSALLVHGPQAGGDGPLAALWMFYARADRRWAGADLTIISLELLTVSLGAPIAAYICYLIARRDPRVNIWMLVLATAELYGGFMTFCPEWLTANHNLDASNFMYRWVYLVFFNALWVFIPAYAIYVAVADILEAFRVRDMVSGVVKSK